MKRISIIIAAFNCEEYIKVTIDSIKKQTYKNWELIICDDASTDNTFDLIKSESLLDNRITVFKNEENLFAAETRNKCIEIATGEYIAIQDADDYSDESRIERQVSYLNNNKEIDFVGSWSQSFDGDDYWKTGKPKEYPLSTDFLKGFPFVHASIMFRKNSLNKVGNYRVSKETKRGQDTDLIMRMYANDLKGANIQEVLYYYREDLSTFKRRSFKNRLVAVKVMRDRFSDLGLLPRGYIYLIKPIIGGLIPSALWFKLSKFRSRQV